MLHGVQPLQQGTEPTNPHWRVGEQQLPRINKALQPPCQSLAPGKAKIRGAGKEKLFFLGGVGATFL